MQSYTKYFKLFKSSWYISSFIVVIWPSQFQHFMTCLLCVEISQEFLVFFFLCCRPFLSGLCEIHDTPLILWTPSWSLLLYKGKVWYRNADQVSMYFTHFPGRRRNIYKVNTVVLSLTYSILNNGEKWHIWRLLGETQVDRFKLRFTYLFFFIYFPSRVAPVNSSH